MTAPSPPNPTPASANNPPAADADPTPIPSSPPAFVPARPPRFWRAQRFVRSLNPLRVFFGPVFQREIRVTGRRRSTYVVRLLVLAVPTAFVALFFATTTIGAGRFGQGQNAAASIQSLQEVAFTIAATVAWCQLITLAMVAPLLTAGALVEERTARTLSAIAASPLTPGAVIGGLFASRMVNLAILALLPLPLLLAIRTFGGLDVAFVLWSFAIAVCSAVATAAVGLWASVRTARTAAAVSAAIMVMLLQWSFPLLLFLAESAMTFFTKPGSFEGIPVSPPAALAVLLFGGPGSGMFGLGSEETAAFNCLVSLGIAVAALLLARWQLARLIATDRVELVRQPSRRQRERARAALQSDPAAGDAVAEPVGADADRSRTVTGNPVFWREVRQPLFQTAWKRWLSVIGVVTVVLAVHVSTLDVSRSNGEALVFAPTMVGLIILLLSAAAVPAGSISTEREAQTWATLLITPLSPFQILLPKIAGAMRRAWPPYLLVGLHLLLCALRGLVSPMALPFTFLHFTVYLVFLSATGVFFSLCCRKSAAAATLNLVMVLTLWMLGPIFIALLAEIAGVHQSNLFAYTSFAHPVITCAMGVVGLCERGHGFEMPGTGRLSGAEFTGAWLASVAFYICLAGLVMQYAKAAFHRLSTARL